MYPVTLRLRAIRQARLDKIASRAIDSVASAIASRDPPVRKRLFYGASAINPRHLVTWYIFDTDAELERAKLIGLTLDIDSMTRRELNVCGYPAKGVPLMHVAFTSMEDIEKKAGGNFYLYFK